MAGIESDPHWQAQQRALQSERSTDSDEVRAYRALLNRLNAESDPVPRALISAARAVPVKARAGDRRERIAWGLLIALTAMIGVVGALPVLAHAVGRIAALEMPWPLLLAATAAVLVGRVAASWLDSRLSNSSVPDRARPANLE